MLPRENKQLERIVLEAWDKCRAASVEQETVRPPATRSGHTGDEERSETGSLGSITDTDTNLSDEPRPAREEELGCEAGIDVLPAMLRAAVLNRK